MIDLKQITTAHPQSKQISAALSRARGWNKKTFPPVKIKYSTNFITQMFM